VRKENQCWNDSFLSEKIKGRTKEQRSEGSALKPKGGAGTRAPVWYATKGRKNGLVLQGRKKEQERVEES